MKLNNLNGIKDMFIGIILIISLWILASTYDFSELLFEYLQKHEEYELDELFLLFSIMGIVSMIFAYRRIVESKKINKQFIDINKKLRTEIHLEIEKKQEQENKIRLQATDSLTLLPNRQKLLENLQENNLKLAIFDLLRFKEINEYYGFIIGDQVLKLISTIFLEYTNEKPITVYKLQTDEFAFLSNDKVSESLFKSYCLEVLNKINENNISIDNNHFDIKVIVGITFQKDYLLTAEMSMNFAKKLKKDMVVFDDNTDIQKNIVQNIYQTKELKRAIEDDRIVVYIQPIFLNKNNSIGKYECLVRMIDKKGKVISPVKFLDIAKKANIYSEITHIVITKSFEYFANREESFSINLTLEDIVSKKTNIFICEMLKIFPSVSNRVIFEIVENEGIENYTEVSTFIKQMTNLGCKIAIDDFGTGYSNFIYLMNLNVDFIKIDGSMIQSLNDDENARFVTQLIVDFAKKLNIKIIAEFVHSADIYDIVKKMDIDYSQGFYLGKPKRI